MRAGLALLTMTCGLLACSPTDPVDRSAPSDPAAQRQLAQTLAEPARSHYLLYLDRMRRSPPAASRTVTVRQAVDLGRSEAATKIDEVATMRDMLIARQVEQARRACDRAPSRGACVDGRNALLAKQGVPAGQRLK